MLRSPVPDFTKPPDPDDRVAYNRYFLDYLGGLMQTVLGQATQRLADRVFCSPGLTGNFEDVPTAEMVLKRGYWVACFNASLTSDTTEAWFEDPDEFMSRFVMKLDNDTWSDFVGWASMVKQHLQERHGKPTRTGW